MDLSIEMFTFIFYRIVLQFHSYHIVFIVSLCAVGIIELCFMLFYGHVYQLH